MKEIKVFSDFSCPFCYIGLTIVDKLGKEEDDVDILYYPYILDDKVPYEGADLGDSIPKEMIDMAYKRIERLGKEYGLVFNNKTRKFNTLRLHKASLYARSENKFFEFSKEAFRYIFEENKNVADSEVVNKIARQVGLDATKMNEEIDKGTFDLDMEEALKLSKACKIESVPTFIIDESKQVTTLKDYEKFKRDLLE